MPSKKKAAEDLVVDKTPTLLEKLRTLQLKMHGFPRIKRGVNKG